MSEMWRVIDTGLLPAAQNIALNRALLEARRAEEIPSTLRFLRFAPSALLGYHQSAEQELDLDYCKAGNIAIQRRITGGGAIYCDEAQARWELYLQQRDVGSSRMPAIAKRICHAAATAISALGVDARFRPRNEIEVDGRKISDSSGVFDGDALLYQGTLLVDLDIEKMLRILRFPAAQPLAMASAPACARVTHLKGLLGRRPDLALIKRNITEAFESEFDVEFHEADLTLTEHQRYRTALAEIDTPDWVNLVRRPASDVPVCEAAQKFAGGMLRVNLTYDRVTHRIKHVRFTGDVRVRPPRVIADLEAALQDTPAERIEQNIGAFFAGRRVEMLMLTPADFVNAIRLALKLPLAAQSP